MSRFFTVAFENWKKQVKSPSFWLMVFLPFLIVIVGGVVGYFTGSGLDNNKVAVVADEEYRHLFAKNELVDFTFEKEDAAKKDLKDKEIAGYLMLSEDDKNVKMDYYSTGLGAVNSFYLENLAKEIQNSINSQNANLTKEQSEIMTRNPVINYYQVDDKASNPVAMGLYFGSVLIMYMALILYSNIMIMDVAVEKGTKILEFIFSSVKATTYFAGKIAGNFMLILTQALIYVIFGILGFGIVKFTGVLDKISIDLSVVPNLGLVLFEMLGFLVFGILIYMIMAAMLGSLVSKQEDASKMATPIMVIPIIAYIIAMSFIGRGPNLFIKVLSYIPFVSSFFMPMRLAFSDASLFEGLISIVILAAGCVVAYIIAAKVYKKNILNYSSSKLFGRGKRMKAKEKKNK